MIELPPIDLETSSNKLALVHLVELEDQIRLMREMHMTPKHLIDACDGDDKAALPHSRRAGEVAYTSAS